MTKLVRIQKCEYCHWDTILWKLVPARVDGLDGTVTQIVCIDCIDDFLLWTEDMPNIAKSLALLMMARALKKVNTPYDWEKDEEDGKDAPSHCNEGPSWQRQKYNRQEDGGRRWWQRKAR